MFAGVAAVAGRSKQLTKEQLAQDLLPEIRLAAQRWPVSSTLSSNQTLLLEIPSATSGGE